MEKLAYRRSLGVTGVMLILASLFLVIAGPAQAADGELVQGNCNEQGGWDQNVASGPWGTITNNGDGSVSVDLNPGWSLDLCVKGGNDHLVYQVTTAGVSGPYWPPSNCGQGQNQCGLSHWAIREVDFETTTTSDDETTTTDDSTTTTDDSTTTTDDSTTTTDDSTTTTDDSTTTTDETTTTTGQTTTTAPTTTTTRVNQTTASTAATTASTAPTTASTTGNSVEVTVSVGGIQVTAPGAAQVTQATLPFTGLSTTSIATLAAGLAALGLLLLAGARQVDEAAPARRW